MNSPSTSVRQRGSKMGADGIWRLRLEQAPLGALASGQVRVCVEAAPLPYPHLHHHLFSRERNPMLLAGYD